MNVLDSFTDLIDRSAVQHLATGGPNGIPFSTRAVGGYVVPQSGEAVVFIPKCRSERTLRNLDRNPNLALLLVDPQSYRALQVKGHLLAAAECSEDDYRIQDLYFLRMRRHSFPDRYYDIVRKPALALRFRIVEGYDQTPGPGAGNPVEVTRKGGDA